MTTYLSDRKKRYSKWTRLTSLIVFLLVVSFFWKEIKITTYQIALPIASVVIKVTDGVFSIPSIISTYITTQKTFSERIVVLEKNIELLENKIASQNTDLERYVSKDELQTKGHLTTLEVYPIAQDLYFLYSTILISKGFTDGIEEGMIVYTRGYEPVGTVRQVYSNTSLVSLFSVSGNKVNGFTGENKIVLALIGDGGGTFIAQIPKDVEVVIGDNVFLSQNPMMRLGSIVDVQGSQQDFFKTVYVRGIYNPAKQNSYFIDK